MEKKINSTTGRQKRRGSRIFNYQTDRDWVDNLAIVTQLGLTMVGCILFCLFVGHYLDKWTGLKGVFTTIFILLGIAGGANVCYRQIIEVTDPKPKDDSDDHRANPS
ncbi:AtpZ/AtpI family protein [Desulfosarcina sp. OttesenSCG-928-A07]|nr:AtpZ/AtpI family protein [Desulfosarcina sp. OttesenSCG-928-G17]MDL2328273.1 AtpZ/AtpI family protein [Desulfosarcina sp. OttesenSCG-928-A07]